MSRFFKPTSSFKALLPASQAPECTPELRKELEHVESYIRDQFSVQGKLRGNLGIFDNGKGKTTALIVEIEPIMVQTLFGKNWESVFMDTQIPGFYFPVLLGAKVYTDCTPQEAEKLFLKIKVDIKPDGFLTELDYDKATEQYSTFDPVDVVMIPLKMTSYYMEEKACFGISLKVAGRIIPL